MAEEATVLNEEIAWLDKMATGFVDSGCVPDISMSILSNYAKLEETTTTEEPEWMKQLKGFSAKASEDLWRLTLEHDTKTAYQIIKLGYENLKEEK